MLSKNNRKQDLVLFVTNVRKLCAIRDPLPVIKVPKYLKTSLNRVRYNEDKRVNQIIQKDNQLNADNRSSGRDVSSDGRYDPNICIISTNTKKLNHFLGQKYKSYDKIPLVSNEWMNGSKTFGKYHMRCYCGLRLGCHV